MRTLLIVLLSLAAAPPTLCAPGIEWDTDGGDAWARALKLSGRIHGGCDEIWLRSPTAHVLGVIVEERFTGVVPLLPGDNEIIAECRVSSRTVSESRPLHLRVPLSDTPKAWVRIWTDKSVIRLDAGRTERAPARAAPIVRYEWFSEPDNPAPLRTSHGERLLEHAGIAGEQLQLESPIAHGEYYVRLRVLDALGRSDESRAVFRVGHLGAERVDLDSEHPKWVNEAVLYGATPYMFEPQSFEGVRERLDEIAALGATALWLSPVTDAAPDDFGYAVTNHFSLRARFGDANAFRRLVREARGKGLRVIVDFVPNHVSDQHEYHQRALKQGARSPYYDWFDRNEAGEITQYFDWAHLKNLDYDSPEVQNYMIEAFRRFVRDFEVDGFRVDASWAVARRAPEFWPRLREELKRIDPNLFLLAEASAREPYHVANGFDAAYDWTHELGQWAWHDAFVNGTVNAAKLRAALTNDGQGFPPDTLTLRFLNNNDTGARFVTRHGLTLTKLAATLMFTLPGIPLIYNGDEIGAEFEPYDEGPPFEWNDQHPLTAHYRALTALRAQTPALRTRKIELLETKNEEDVLAYLRPDESGDDALVILNFGKKPVEVSAGDDECAKTFTRFARARDLLSGGQVQLPFQVAPQGAVVLVAGDDSRKARQARKAEVRPNRSTRWCTQTVEQQTRKVTLAETQRRGDKQPEGDPESFDGAG